MALSVALPSFDAFLRSARRAPAVLPCAAPTAYRPLTIPSDVHDHPYGYESPVSRFSSSAVSSSFSAVSPPGSPYYGHFVSLSPTSSPVSEADADIDPWRTTSTLSSSSDMEDDSCEYGSAAVVATRYQDLLTQPCVAIAPRPRNAVRSDAYAPADVKPVRTKKKYLKERQRCEIVRRVRAGEKQAHLAKEFGVSRAAVCYLLKHEFDILRRSALRQQRRNQLH